jgi:ligand-binding sensor domain-containing protein
LFRQLFILIVVIFFTSLCGKGQIKRLTFKHLTRSTGLPIDHVTSLAQDSSGFIWIGSTEGLFRYDGFNFKTFYSEPGNTGTLPENIITTIFVSSKGLLWIGTRGGGISCMKPGGSVTLTFNSRNTGFITQLANHVTGIIEDRSGNIWWSSVDGLFKFSPKSAKPVCYKMNSPGPRDNLINGLLMGADGKIWVAGFLGIRLFDPATRLFSEPASQLLKLKKDVASLGFQNNKVWFSSWIPDLAAYDTANNKLTVLYSGANAAQPEFQRMSNGFYLDKKGGLWIATGKGLVYAAPGQEEQVFTSEPGNNYSIINDDVTCVLEDREGNFWFGTKQGLSISQPYNEKVINVSTNNLQHMPYGDKQIKTIIQVDANTLLVGTHYADGIYETDSGFNVRNHFVFNDAKYDWVWNYYDDKPRDRFFISTQVGMLIYNKKDHSLVKAQDPLFNHRFTISAMVATSDSIIWMTRFRNSFIRYNLVTGSYKEYDIQDFGEPPQVLYLSKDRENRIWLVAHSSGMLRFDEKAGKVAERLVVNNTTQSLQQSNLIFFEDLGSYYIIGYHTKGISLYDKKTKRYYHFSRADGLASNNTRSVFIENSRRVWIATTNGISLFDPVAKTFKNYGYESGILNNDFLSITQLQSGKMVAGSTKGLVAFTPDQLDQAGILMPPIITGINVYGKKLMVDEMAGDPLRISYRENYFSIDYISLKYNNNADIEYAYKLQGLDKDWISAGGRRFASYSNIKGGKYYFKVRARRPGEPWVESTAALPIIVTSAFYTRWWFYILCLGLIAAFVYMLFRYRLHQVLKMERMRTTISSDLHDEVGASLTSISIFSEMARKSVLPSSKEEQYLQRIGDRSRESIEKMGDIIWSINPDNDTLQQMLVRMKNYATEIAEASDVAVHWREAGNLSGSKLSMEQRKNIYLLFKEIMNNSIKHAGASNIWVNLSASSNVINMTIRDDGKGFDQHRIVQGNGIKSMQRRAAALKGNVVIDSATNKGTSVELAFRY